MWMWIYRILRLTSFHGSLSLTQLQSGAWDRASVTAQGLISPLGCG